MSHSHFTLPLIATLDPSSPNWILNKDNWLLDAESKQAFENARDGQGFAGVVFFERDQKTYEPMARVRLFPTFNGKDNYPREDKHGNPYHPLQYVDSGVGRNRTGAGLIHQNGVKLDILKKHLNDDNSKLSRSLMVTVRQKNKDYDKKSLEEKKHLRDKTITDYLPKLLNHKDVEEDVNAMKGFIFGFGATKGAEYKDEKDYEIRMIESESDIEEIEKTLATNTDKPSSLSQFEKNKKYIVLVKDEKNRDPNTYKIFYIQNQKLVLPPIDQPSPPVIHIDKDCDKNTIVHLTLKAYKLNLPMIIYNKSASQNNSSVSYDFDFENYMMYADEEKYLEGKKLTPDETEYSSTYDLRRSIPPALMGMIFSILLPDNKDSEELMKIFKKKWSSWDNPPHDNYDAIIKSFEKETTEKKRAIVERNIYLTLLFFYKTSEKFSDLTVHSSQDDRHSFHFYFIELERRLDSLVLYYQSVSEQKFSERNNFINPFSSFTPRIKYERHLSEEEREKISLKEYIKFEKNSLEISEKKLKEVQGDINVHHELQRNLDRKRSLLNEIIRSIGNLEEAKLSQASEFYIRISMVNEGIRHEENIGVERYDRGLVKHIQDKIQNPEKIKQSHKKYLAEMALKICSAKKSTDVLHQFLPNSKSMLNSLKYTCSDAKEIKSQLRSLLQITDPESGMTALENAIQNKWYDVVQVLVFYGADMDQKNEKTMQSAFDIFINQIVIAAKEKENMNVLDYTLSNILTLSNSINPHFMGKIKNILHLLPRSQKILEPTHMHKKIKSHDFKLYKTNPLANDPDFIEKEQIDTYSKKAKNNISK
jgi:hypothetical protein